MTTTDQWVRSRTIEYLRSVPPGILEDAETAEYLAAVFAGIARVDVVPRNNLLRLARLLDPALCRPEFLPYLGTLVGLDRTLGLTRYLDESGWRRFLSYASDIWRAKGVTYRNMLHATVGRPCWIGGWHEIRNVLGVTPVPLLGVESALGSYHAERISVVHAPDPFGNYAGVYTPAAGESAVNRDLVHAGLRAILPIQQRIDLFYVDWLDDFSQGAPAWRTVSGNPFTTGDHYLATQPTSQVIYDVGNVAYHFHYGVWDAWMRIIPENANPADLMYRYDEADGGKFRAARFDIDPANPLAGRVRIVAFDGVGVATIADTNPYEVHANQWMRVTVICEREGANDRHSVYVNGQLAATGTEVTDATVTGFGGFGGRRPIDVQFVEQYRIPAPFKRIGSADAGVPMGGAP